MHWLRNGRLLVLVATGHARIGPIHPAGCPVFQLINGDRWPGGKTMQKNFCRVARCIAGFSADYRPPPANEKPRVY
jgi:hypothetical protein